MRFMSFKIPFSVFSQTVVQAHFSDVKNPTKPIFSKPALILQAGKDLGKQVGNMSKLYQVER